MTVDASRRAYQETLVAIARAVITDQHNVGDEEIIALGNLFKERAATLDQPPPSDLLCALAGELALNAMLKMKRVLEGKRDPLSGGTE